MGEDLAISILTIAEVSHFYSSFNPSIFTIRRFPDDQTVNDISLGCLVATMFGCVLAAATSIIAKSMKPLLFGTLGIIAMNLIYTTVAISAADKKKV